MAAIQVTVNVYGGAELSRALARLPDVVDEKITQQALAAGGAIILSAARDNIHNRTGATAADLRMEIQQPARDQGVVAIGGTTKGRTGRAYVLRWLEFGTKAHPILAGEVFRRDVRRVKRLTRGLRGAALSSTIIEMARRRAPRKRALRIFPGVYRSSAQHPGAKGQSVLTRALFENGEAALKAYGEAMWAGIKRVTPIIRAGG